MYVSRALADSLNDQSQSDHSVTGVQTLVLPTCKIFDLYVYEKVRALTGVSRAEDQKYVFEHRVNDNTKTLSQITCTLEWPGTF